MTDPVDSAPTSSPANAPAQSGPATETPSQQTLPIRDAKSAKPNPAQTDKPAKGKDAAAPAGTEADAAGEKPLTPAELKKKAKAEKAARRVKEKLERDGGAGAAGGSAPAPGQPRPPVTPRKDAPGGAAQKGSKALPPRRGSLVGASAAVEQKKKKEDKSVAVFGHLYGQQRRTTIAGAGKEVHPAVLALGLQLRDYVVCGSSARCVATMLAFKRVSLILSYIPA
jgi:translation initiation factor eIF-2B subunit delta